MIISPLQFEKNHGEERNGKGSRVLRKDRSGKIINVCAHCFNPTSHKQYCRYKIGNRGSASTDHGGIQSIILEAENFHKNMRKALDGCMSGAMMHLVFMDFIFRHNFLKALTIRKLRLNDVKQLLLDLQIERFEWTVCRVT